MRPCRSPAHSMHPGAACIIVAPDLFCRLPRPNPTHPPAQEHIKREKAVMAEFDSPFLVNLVAAFQASRWTGC